MKSKIIIQTSLAALMTISSTAAVAGESEQTGELSMTCESADGVKLIGELKSLGLSDAQISKVLEAVSPSNGQKSTEKSGQSGLDVRGSWTYAQ